MRVHRPSQQGHGFAGTPGARDHDEHWKLHVVTMSSGPAPAQGVPVVLSGSGTAPVTFKILESQPVPVNPCQLFQLDTRPSASAGNG